MTSRISVVLCLAMLLASGSASAAVLEDFQFTDANGTLLGAAINNVNTGNLWNEDPIDSINSSVLNGKYWIQRNDEELTTNYLDIDNITTGKAWLVAEIAGWNFTPTLGGGEVFEEFRIAFLQNDTSNQGGSTSYRAV